MRPPSLFLTAGKTVAEYQVSPVRARSSLGSSSVGPKLLPVCFKVVDFSISAIAGVPSSSLHAFEGLTLRDLFTVFTSKVLSEIRMF